MSKSLNPDQAERFVRPDLGPNFLQKLSDSRRHLEIKSKTGTFVKFSLVDAHDEFYISTWAESLSSMGKMGKIQYKNNDASLHSEFPLCHYFWAP